MSGVEDLNAQNQHIEDEFEEYYGNDSTSNFPDFDTKELQKSSPTEAIAAMPTQSLPSIQDFITQFEEAQFNGANEYLDAKFQEAYPDDGVSYQWTS